MQKKFKMLIIDDEMDLGDMMCILLKDSDVEISRALTLKEGKTLWEEEFPHIVLLDNHLPDGLGLEMVEANNHLLANCKVIMVTADEKIRLKKRAEDAGIGYFIQKPLNLKLIRELVKNMY
jgi:two-component system, OmpR family, response regulator